LARCRRRSAFAGVVPEEPKDPAYRGQRHCAPHLGAPLAAAYSVACARNSGLPDQGWQYRMPAYQRQLREREREFVQSMSCKGNCHDNAAMESFFGILMSEFFYLNRFDSVGELRARLAAFAA
jgi:transposase InsO family protein